MTINIVPWCGLTWIEAENQGFMPDIEKHLENLVQSHGAEHAKGYLNFIKNNPSNIKPKV